ncbi:ganglioside GM2 activator-like [Callorhinchus milii]|uniref:ganglioside GM2 activator-like n=1 Tax=Callorhinchus milii TaxID=7868 RepID=UPI0004574EBE|nr:ganglioside GM2 activator-like [Callorhinchus milii]XP_007900185.1 ganglioside GM2 activator-like [Callorhinchus milii]|eukprot:gi/632967807/ref/XP_007900184.1/ PREDICTED: ganglioside GM2 activator-like [Callorhinchus milii]
MPGGISVKGSAFLSQAISSLKAEITLYRKVLFFWLKIPCVTFDCVYEVCKLLKRDPSCSFKQGFHKFPGKAFVIPRLPIPNGQYSIAIDLKSHRRNVGCVQMDLTVKKN